MGVAFGEVGVVFGEVGVVLEVRVALVDDGCTFLRLEEGGDSCKRKWHTSSPIRDVLISWCPD